MRGKKQNKNNANKLRFGILSTGLVILLFAAFVLLKGLLAGQTASTVADGDLVINKSDISETAKFFPYKSGNTKMEIISVKASDGTIRTAFNTCQVCYDSGRGYYKQQGNELVCQNCGNEFKIDEIEMVKGGCNPVPILKEQKTEDEKTIVISKELLAKGKDLFANWKK